MSHLVRFIVAVVFLPCFSGWSERADPHVEALIGKMTLEEKAGQLGVFARPGGSDFNPGTGSDWKNVASLLRKGLIGSLYNGAGVKANLELQRIAVEESRLGIPIIFGADVWHGMRTVFPIPLGEAASFEPELARETARATADEATASGIQWTYAPMVDVSRDQRWGRVAEGAGEDPFLGQAFARARVQGYQGPDLTANDSMAACLKHFAGYGGVQAGLDYSAADTSQATFRDVFLPPFRAGIEAGALTLMSAFVSVLGGVPASGNRWLQTKVLRHELGFDGFVVSDYEADLELINHGYATNESDAAQKALWAGVDMSMQSGIYRTHLPDLVQGGQISLETLDTSVRRVLNVKSRMGLLENPYRSLDVDRESKRHWVPEHDALARHVARKSIVMLKNNGGILPLSRKKQKIALVGWWIDDQDNEEGCGVVWGNRSHVVTLAQGIADAVDDKASVRKVTGSGVEVPYIGGLKAATEAAHWADVVVLALGEATNFTGEAESRTDIVIPEAQRELAEALAATGKPLVVLLKNGRALALDGAVKDASAILVTWFLGKQTGHAIADILFGDYSPSGRLPISFPLRAGQQPYFYNHMSSGRPCTGENRAFKNCWRQIGNDALYPFGHGLTFTKFSYSIPTLSSSMLWWDGAIIINATVTNIGDRAGEEVVQLYVHDRVASRVRPVRELKGFVKVFLGAGESHEVTFTLDRQALTFAVADTQLQEGADVMVVEPGMFDVWVTSSATAGAAVEFELLAPQCSVAQALSQNSLMPTAQSDVAVPNVSASSASQAAWLPMNLAFVVCFFVGTLCGGAAMFKIMVRHHLQHGHLKPLMHELQSNVEG